MKKPGSPGHLGRYLLMLAMIHYRPASTEAIAKKVGVQIRVAHRTMRLLEDALMVHVSHWIVPQGRRAESMEVWAFGIGTSAPRPLGNRGRGNSRSRERPDGARVMPLKILKLLEVLQEGGTRQQMAEHSGISMRSLTELVPMMQERRLIHIGDWKKRAVGGEPMEVFFLGKGEDAPRPEPIPHVITKARYRQRQRLKEVSGSNSGYSVFTPNVVMPPRLSSID